MDTATSGNHHREHAEHNEEVYHYLRKDLKFIDWIITAAFYTSIYYVQYRLFPCNITFAGNEKTFKSIEEYHDFCGAGSVHASRIRIVSQQLVKCRRAYKELHDLCMTARYNQYKFSNPKAVDKRVAGWLSEVKEACLEPRR